MHHMDKALDILIVITTNLIGFLSISICFFTLLALGFIHEDYFTTHSNMTFEYWSSTTMIVWIICAIFSICGLFIKRKERYLMMAAPGIIPLLYGFITLYIFGGLFS
ncbi:MAG: hypothetical protein CMH27_01180 [Micavibrio sp.]|nr:hypothetical protein [Micavibrio sp.]